MTATELPSAERRRLRRDIGWNLLPVALLAGVGLGLNFAINEWWGKAALGAFNLVTISYFTMSVLGACGLQYAVLRAVAEDPDDRERVASQVVGALIPSVVLAGAATGLYLVLRGPIGELQGTAVAEGMLWVAPGLFSFTINKVLLGVVNGLRRMRAFALYTSLRYFLIGLGLVFARVWRLDPEQLPVIWTFAEGTLLLVLIGELIRTVKLSRGSGWVAWAKRHLDYGMRGVTATLAFELNSKLDVWMLGNVVSNAQVGIYSIASALYEGVMQLAVVLQNNVNPVLARQIANGDIDGVEQLVRRTRRWFVPTLCGAALIGAMVYPYLIPWLIGDPSFIGGAWPFAIMMIGIASASAYLPFNQMLLMASRPGWHTIYILGMVAVNLLGNSLLAPVLALEGAALSAAAALAASALFLRLLVRWRVGIRV